MLCIPHVPIDSFLSCSVMSLKWQSDQSKTYLKCYFKVMALQAKFCDNRKEIFPESFIPIFHAARPESLQRL